MTWTETRVGNVLTLKRGYDLPSSARHSGSVPVVSSSGITGSHSIAKIAGPGVVTGRYGTLGKVFYVDEDFWPLNTSLYVEDFKGNSPHFVAYFLRHILRRPPSDKAAVPGVNRNHIHARPVRFPHRALQERIVTLLSPYDDAIDNNLRRIKLLEEAARLLYSEWFVQLRFPAHTHVDVRDGVPEGWQRRALGEIAPLKYGKGLRKDDRVPGPYPVYGSSGIVGTHKKPLVSGPGIVVGRKGNVGSVYWSVEDFYPIDTVYYIESQHFSTHLYYALLSMPFMSTDVAVPGLNRKFAHSREVLVPTTRILALFEEITVPMHSQIDLLKRYNHRLAQARDLLLPRLMNGEVAV
jgi:type I restriction enzyme, S subunit